MYNQNYKVEIPQFPDREVSIAEYGAKSGDLQIETGRHNAEVLPVFRSMHRSDSVPDDTVP